MLKISSLFFSFEILFRRYNEFEVHCICIPFSQMTLEFSFNSIIHFVIDQAWDQDGWILAELFLCVFMDRDEVIILYSFSFSCRLSVIALRNIFSRRHALSNDCWNRTSLTLISKDFLITSPSLSIRQKIVCYVQRAIFLLNLSSALGMKAYISRYFINRRGIKIAVRQAKRVM